MKIAQIIPTLDRSGAEKQMLLLCRELKLRGHDVQVAALTRLGPLASEFESAGIPVHRIGKSLKVDPFALIRLGKWMREGDFDVVQSWIFAANSYSRAAARMVFGRNRTRPCVIATEMAVDLWKSRWNFRVDQKLWLIPAAKQQQPHGRLLGPILFGKKPMPKVKRMASLSPKWKAFT